MGVLMAENIECNDRNCFIHGNLHVRGRTMTGTVVSAKGRKTVIVERPRMIYIFKYKRYAKAKSRIPAHNPPCINAKEGDIVRIGECRKISRTKAWTVLEIVEKARELKEKSALKEKKVKKEHTKKELKESKEKAEVESQ
jgi:small subunit ribosomal protein S17